MCTPIRDVAIGEMLDRKRIVDLGGGHVVDRKGVDIGLRQILRQKARRYRRKASAMREEFGEKARFMQRPRRRNPAAFEHQTRLRDAACRGRRLKRLVFDGVLVRPGQEAQGLAGERFGQTAGLQLFFVLRLHQPLLTLALERGERKLELLLRRALILAPALATEVHRRAMHAQHQRRTFYRAERRAEVVGAQRRKREFVVGRAFPQEIEIDLLRCSIGLLDQIARARLLEFDQHVFCPHLGAPAARQLDLKRIALARQHAARLETTRFLKENVHSILSF